MASRNTGAAPSTDAAADWEVGAVIEPVPETVSADEALPIEELRKELQIKDSLFAGIVAANRWRPGKQVSVKEFKAAVEAFSVGAMGRREKRCSGT